jgi:hypothetical protein
VRQSDTIGDVQDHLQANESCAVVESTTAWRNRTVDEHHPGWSTRGIGELLTKFEGASPDGGSVVAKWAAEKGSYIFGGFGDDCTSISGGPDSVKSYAQLVNVPPFSSGEPSVVLPLLFDTQSVVRRVCGRRPGRSGRRPNTLVAAWRIALPEVFAAMLYTHSLEGLVAALVAFGPLGVDARALWLTVSAAGLGRLPGLCLHVSPSS